MKLHQYIDILSKRSIIFTIGFLLLLINEFTVNAQSHETLTVPIDLDFGTFATSGQAGTITINPTGPKGDIGSTGGISTLSTDFHAATINIYFKNQGHVTICCDKSVNLTGTKGGKIKLEPSLVSGTYNKPRNSSYMDIYIGGKLTIDNQTIDPPGLYTGTFNVYYTFIH